MIPLSMTLSDLWPPFQGHDIFLKSNIVKTVLKTKLLLYNWELYLTYGMVLFGDLDWPPNASRRFVSISWASCLLWVKTYTWRVLERPAGMPWLYYTRGSAPSALNDDGIPTEFRFPDDVISFRVHAYSLSGTSLGYHNVSGGLLQLCRNSQRYLNDAYVFGVTYLQTVSSAVIVRSVYFHSVCDLSM